MARPRKARVEGAAAVPYADRPEIAPLADAPRKAPDPVPGDNGAALTRIVEFFKSQHPELWDSIALCPLQHGLTVMADKLDG